MLDNPNVVILSYETIHPLDLLALSQRAQTNQSRSSVFPLLTPHEESTAPLYRAYTYVLGVRCPRAFSVQSGLAKTV